MKVAAIVGSYHKGGVTDRAVDAILASASAQGALVEKIHLADIDLRFCSNCRSCMQREGAARGVCPIPDQMAGLLDRVEEADAIVLASAMNFGTVTALMKRFIERLACYAYWPWGSRSPRPRCGAPHRRAVLVATCAAPAFLARLATPMAAILRQAAGLLGARTVGVLFVGCAALEQSPPLGVRASRKARLLGKKLLGGRV